MSEHYGYGTDSTARIYDEVRSFVHEHVLRVAEARERACEAAVQSGFYGVMETEHQDGSISFELSSAVPYGCIGLRREWQPAPHG